MKNLKYILSSLLIFTASFTFAQTEPEITNKIVANKNYIFVANTAIPMANAEMNKILSSMPGGMGGGSISLTGAQYNLIVTKDSIIAYLPYYGRAYSAPINPTEGGINFTSKDFSYKQSKNKKGAYTIQINTNDVKVENYRLTLSISENGYASLNVSSMNKQAITFNGYLEEPKVK